ncbi:hypothetical protein V8F20_008840 [Naviculisporaceae sp. PSN 640]
MRIKFKGIGSTWETELDIEPKDTIWQIKERLEKQEGTPAIEQRFIYLGHTLYDYDTAEYYKLEDGTTIFFILYRYRRGYTVYDRNHYYQNTSGPTICLDIEPRDTIAQIKEKLEKKEGIPAIEQHYICRAVELEDRETAEYYGLTDGSQIYFCLIQVRVELVMYEPPRFSLPLR